MEQVSFPSSAVGPMLEGYCDDFVSFAASLAQTLEQVTMRKLPFEKNRASLQRVEHGMREIADAIGALLRSAPAEARPAAAATEARAPAAEPPKPAAAAPAAAAAAAAAAATGTATVAAPPAKPRQTAPAPADAPPGRVVMQGSTDDLPIASVFQFLGQTRKCGTLRVHAAGETVSFTLAGGKIEATSTDRSPPAERLGDILLELGMLTREQIEPLARQNQLLGGELVRARLLTNDQLLHALRQQMQRRYQRVANARPATYVFFEAPGVEPGRVRVSAGELRAGGRAPAPHAG